jgi:hypothetical protein
MIAFPKPYRQTTQEDERQARKLAIKNKKLYLRPNDPNNLYFENKIAKVLLFICLPRLNFGFTIYFKHTDKKISKRASSLKNAYLDACLWYEHYLKINPV